MINQNKLLQALNLREDDSKRIDAILEAMASKDDLQDLTILYFDKGYSMYYDAEFKVFQIDHDGQEITVFKDGREAIDYCLHQPEIEPDFADFSEQSEKLVNRDSSDEVIEDVQEVPTTEVNKSENAEKDN